MINKKIFNYFTATALFLILCSFPFTLLAQTAPLQGLQDIREKTGYAEGTDETTLANNIGVIINALLGLLGIIFIILMLYAGYNWMTAMGDEAKVTKAKDTIIRAVIGLIITVGSFAIWNFIFTAISK